MKLLVLLPIVAGLLGLRLLRAGTLGWALAWPVAIYLFLRFAFVTPVPASVIQLYMGIVLLAIFAYVTSSAERREATFAPLVRLAVEPRHTWALVLVVLAVPSLVAFNVYRGIHVAVEPPAFARTIHPAPPNDIEVHGKTISLSTADNPFRKLEQSDPQAFRAHVDNGRDIYYRNCHFCHGDSMQGNGMYAHGLNPIPTNFTDPATIVQLQESFLFWRIAKGAPGMPDEGGPWESAMPAWEQFLTEEEMWDVILFLYDYTEQRPRALSEAH